MRIVAFSFIVFLASCAPSPKPYFELQSDTDGNIWRIDTLTGDTWVCRHAIPGFPATCDPVDINLSTPFAPSHP